MKPISLSQCGEELYPTIDTCQNDGFPSEIMTVDINFDSVDPSPTPQVPILPNIDEISDNNDEKPAIVIPPPFFQQNERISKIQDVLMEAEEESSCCGSICWAFKGLFCGFEKTIYEITRKANNGISRATTVAHKRYNHCTKSFCGDI